VFSSLHTNTALTALVRLRELGIEPYLIAATLRGVVAQRLVRRVCAACARHDPPTPADAARFADAGLPVPATLPHATGCAACDGTGFAGRVGVFDILEIDDAIRAAIERGAGETVLREAAGRNANGLIIEGLRRAAVGETTLDELTRVLGEAG